MRTEPLPASKCSHCRVTKNHGRLEIATKGIWVKFNVEFPICECY